MSQKIAITSLKLETCVNRPRENYTAYNETIFERVVKMSEEEYWDTISELEENTKRENQLIINHGGNLDDPPKLFKD